MINKNYKLELIRGVAAMLVVFCHLFVLNPSLVGKDFGLISNWGTEAVVLFFVLSGVVIGLVYDKGQNKPITFALKRIIRIYPLLVISVLSALLVTFLINNGFKSGQSEFGAQVLSSKLVVSSLLMLGTLQGEIAPVLQGNIALWSLSYESFFYLMFTLFLVLNKRIFLWFWLAISILLIPGFYMENDGWLRYLITHFVFSFPWILGFLFYQYAHRLNYFTFYDALFFASCLPILARVEFTEMEYCIIKYDLFSIGCAPLFLYCINSGKGFIFSHQKAVSWYLKFIYFVVLTVLLFTWSNSRIIAKVFYVAFPIVTFLTIKYIPWNQFKATLTKVGVWLGGVSYGIYIIHFPILLLLSKFISNIYIFSIGGIVIILLLSHWLEHKIHPMIAKYLLIIVKIK